MISAPIRSDAFVGRSEELAFLHARAQAALEGGASSIVITGDRGIGKSRLLDEFFDRHRDVLRVVRVRCSPTLRDPLALLNALSEGLASLLRREPPDAVALDRALAYVRGAIRTARASGPLAIAVEDVQYVAPGAIDALEQVGDLDRTLLVLTVVPEDAPPDVREVLARPRSRAAYEMQLAPLVPEAMRRMVRRLQSEGGTLPRATVTRVIRLANGNPALAEDLVRAALRGVPDDDRVPPAMRVRARRLLDHLETPARHLLLIAAAIGEQFDARTLVSVARERLPAVLEALQAAVSAGLVREDGPQHFAFTHPLYREALRAETTPSFATPYHRRTATQLQRTAASSDAFERVAEQWRGAGDLDLAAQWDERAGDAACEDEDFVRGAAAYRRAQADVPAGALRPALAYKCASALRRAGLAHEALEAFDAYLAGARADDEEQHAHALLQTMQLRWEAGDLPGVDATAARIAALALPPESIVPGRALVQLAGMRWTSGRPDETRELLARVERDHRLTDPETLGQFHQQRALLLYAEGRFEDAIADFQRGIAFIERTNNAALLVLQLCNFGNIAMLHARNELALEMLARAHRAAATISSESRIHFATASYARALMRVGRNAEAREVIDQLRHSDADLSELYALYTVVAMLELGSLLDDDALIERALDSDAMTLAFRSAEPQRILPLASAFALHAWHAGDEDGARELLHRALHASEHITWNYHFPVLIAQFGALADVPRARRMLEPPRVVGEPHVIAAFQALFEAFVARRRGRSTTAARLGRTAAETFAALGWPSLEAHAREVAGDHGEALRVYDRIGDVRDATKLRAAMRPPRRSGRHAVALTARERDVALLAVEGLSNAEIAVRLTIGVRTVEHHLQVLYGKFGVRSRWQLPHDL